MPPPPMLSRRNELDADLLNRLWCMDPLDMPLKKIAERLGVTVGTLILMEREHDLPPRPKSPWNKGKTAIDTAALFRLWHADPAEMPSREIAKRLCVSISTLHKFAQRHKLPPRPRVVRDLTVDPTPEEIEQRAAECRELHYAKRRRESDDDTRKRVWMEDKAWHQTSSLSRA